MTCWPYKLKSYGISGWVFVFTSFFLSNRLLGKVLDENFSQKNSVNAGALYISIFGPTFFLLNTNNLSDDVIRNICIYADDTTL